MKPKEQAIEDFKKMIYASWTFGKLTEKEKENLNKSFDFAEKSSLIGNWKQRLNQLQAVYNGFLLALDYKPMGWR
jgi:hypothetical protein